MSKLKKSLCAVLSAAVILSAVSSSAIAERDISVLLDGINIEFDVPPQIINERTMVPLRAIFEALGAVVEWDGETRTVTASKDDINISLKIDSAQMYVNDREVTLDSPATIVDDRTLVPVRAISEAFGSTVEWNDETSTVTILSKAAELIKETAEAVKSQITNKINVLRGGSGGGSSSSSSSSSSPSPAPVSTVSPAPSTYTENSKDDGIELIPSAEEKEEGFSALSKWLTENGTKADNGEFYITASPDASLLNKFGVRLYDMECKISFDPLKKTITMSAGEISGENPLSFEMTVSEGEDTAKCSIDYKGTVSEASFNIKKLTPETEDVSFKNFPADYDDELKEFYSQLYTNAIKEMTFAMNLTLKANGCELRTMDIGFNSMDRL